MAGPSAPYTPGSGRPFGGWAPPAVPKWQTRTGTAMGAMMWLWIFYRAKNDLPHMLGWEKPWDHHVPGGDHGDHH